MGLYVISLLAALPAITNENNIDKLRHKLHVGHYIFISILNIFQVHPVDVLATASDTCASMRSLSLSGSVTFRVCDALGHY